MRVLLPQDIVRVPPLADQEPTGDVLHVIELQNGDDELYYVSSHHGRSHEQRHNAVYDRECRESVQHDDRGGVACVSRQLVPALLNHPSVDLYVGFERALELRVVFAGHLHVILRCST